MNTLDFILEKYGVAHHARAPFDPVSNLPIHLPINRDQLAALFGELGFKTGAEIGVEQGKYSEVLARAMPGAKLHLVDAWRHYRNYRDHVDQQKLDRFYEATKQRVTGYDCELIREFSVEAAKRFKDNSLDVVYIDANHKLEFVIQDLAAWTPKVRPQGICAGHDFFRDKRGGPYHVVPALHAWTDAYRIEPWFICTGDHSASWFYVKS